MDVTVLEERRVMRVESAELPRLLGISNTIFC
jgi:hypothetical protein